MIYYFIITVSMCMVYCVGSCGGQRWKWSLLLSFLVFQESNSCFWACTSFITPTPSASPHLYIFLSLISGIQKLWCLTVGTPGYILIFKLLLLHLFCKRPACLSHNRAPSVNLKKFLNLLSVASFICACSCCFVSQ